MSVRLILNDLSDGVHGSLSLKNAILSFTLNFFPAQMDEIHCIVEPKRFS